MNNFLVLVKKDLLEQWRTKKILTITIIMLFGAIASPILAKMTPEILKSVDMPGLVVNLPTPTYKDALDQYVKNISQIGLLSIIFVAAGAMADEKNRKTLEIILTKPFSRDMLVLSKFKAYFISITAIFAVASAVFYAYTVSLFNSFDLANFALITLGILIYTLMVLSVTVLVSTIVKNSIIAGAFGFLFFALFGTIMGFIDPLKKFSPNIFLEKYKIIVENGWNVDYLLPLVTILVVIFMSMFLAVLSFRGQEIER